MVVGNGMLALSFNEYKHNNTIVIFASGVSNSLETNKKNFLREIELVKRTIEENKDKLFVYFSTCSMYDPLSENSPYVQHKINAENIIKAKCSQYLILRVSQILGHSKNLTLINFLFEKIENKIKFDIWKNSTRNLIALSDVVKITNYLIKQKKYYNQIYHLANEYYIHILKLVETIEEIINIKALYTLLDKGCAYKKIPNDLKKIAIDLEIVFDETYYVKHLHEYSIANKNAKKVDQDE